MFSGSDFEIRLSLSQEHFQYVKDAPLTRSATRGFVVFSALSASPKRSCCQNRHILQEYIYLAGWKISSLRMLLGLSLYISMFK